MTSLQAISETFPSPCLVFVTCVSRKMAFIFSTFKIGKTKPIEIVPHTVQMWDLGEGLECFDSQFLYS